MLHHRPTGLTNIKLRRLIQGLYYRHHIIFVTFDDAWENTQTAFLLPISVGGRELYEQIPHNNYYHVMV